MIFVLFLHNRNTENPPKLKENHQKDRRKSGHKVGSLLDCGNFIFMNPECGEKRAPNVIKERCVYFRFMRHHKKPCGNPKKNDSGEPVKIQTFIPFFCAQRMPPRNAMFSDVNRFFLILA